MILGVVVGTCVDLVLIEGLIFQATEFVPNPKKINVPAGEYVSFDLETGRWTLWSANGDSLEEGNIELKFGDST